MNLKTLYSLPIFKEELCFIIAVISKISDLHSHSLIGEYIPSEVVKLIAFYFLESQLNVTISCGTTHSMILDAHNKLYMCGSNLFNQQGKNRNKIPEMKDMKAFHLYLNTRDVKYISAGYFHSFIEKKEGLFCNDYSDLTNNDLFLKSSPKLGRFRKMYMSVTKILKYYNIDGEKKQDIIEEGEDIKGFKLISCGLKHAFILTKEGLFGFGSTNYGQLGIDESRYITGLVKIKIENVITVSCGKRHSMILTKEGLFSCGDNRLGQLGISFKGFKREKLHKVDLRNVIDVKCGARHTVALTTDGLYACGQVRYIKPFIKDDIFDYDSKSSIFSKSDIQNVISFSCGADFTLVLTTDGLFGCGKSDYGQLGKITPKVFYTFQKIAVDNVVAFACGYEHSLILTRQGLYGCGNNELNQLGINDEDYSKKKLPLTKITKEENYFEI